MGVEALLSFDPNNPTPEKAPDTAEVGVVDAPPVDAGVEEALFPNRFVDCAGFAPPKRLEEGAEDILPNNGAGLPVDAAVAGVLPPAAAPPNNGFCSAGLEAVFPNMLVEVPGVPDEPVVVVVFPPILPKEKLGAPVEEAPKILLEEAWVDEPNKPPAAGALDVVALLD